MVDTRKEGIIEEIVSPLPVHGNLYDIFFNRVCVFQVYVKTRNLQITIFSVYYYTIYRHADDRPTTRSYRRKIVWLLKIRIVEMRDRK